MLNPEIAANRRPIDRLSRNPLLTALALRIQPVIAGIVTGTPTPIRNVLNGTVLGHPLHPAITDVPIGAWTVTAILDTIELAGGPAIAGADAALVIGLAGAVGAIASGYADWSDTVDDPRNAGMAHALLNGSAFVAYLAALWLRRGERRNAGLVVALAGFGLVAAGAYIGGEIAYGQQIGPKHTAEPLSPAAKYTAVLANDELTASKPVRIDFNGIPVLLSRTEMGVAAISAVCTHRGAPLEADDAQGDCVRCPWHGSLFSLTDGSVRQGPASFPQPRFDVRTNGDMIELRAFSI